MDKDNKTSLENAQWFAKQMAYFNNADRQILLSTKSNAEFQAICLRNGVFNSDGLLAGRSDWQSLSSQGVQISLAPGKSETGKNSGAEPGIGSGLGSALGGGSALGLLALGSLRKESYKSFKERSQKTAENAARVWEIEQERILKKPLTKIDPKRPKSRQEAYDKAAEEVHDLLIAGYPKLAQEWAIKHNDPAINRAIERKKQKDLEQAKKLELEKQKNKEEVDRGKASSTSASTPSPEAAETNKPHATESTAQTIITPGTPEPPLESETQSGSYPMGGARDISPATDSIDTNASVPIKPKNYASSPESYSPPDSTPPSPPSPSQPQHEASSHPAPRASNRRNIRGAGLKKRMASKVGRKLAKEAIKKLALSPEGLAIIGIVGLIAFIILIVIGIIGAAQNDPAGFGKEVGLGEYFGASPTPQPGPGPNSDKPTYIYFKGGSAYLIGPNGCVKNCPVNENKEVEMTIHVLINKEDFEGDINKTFANIVTISNYFSIIKTTGSPTRTNYPSLGIDLYKWKLGTLNPGNNEITFTITGKVVASSGGSDVKLSMTGVTYTSGPNASSGDIYASQDDAPTDDPCEGRYPNLSDISNDVTRIPPFKAPILLNKNPNVGDPSCTFKYDLLTQVIRDNLRKYGQNSNDNDLVSFWVNIQRCEGTPNSHNACSAREAKAGSCSALGTWGLYQMSANQSAGKKWEKPSPRGDVPWQRQVQNAIWYNYNEINGNFMHWEAAYCLCSTAKYKDKPYCAVIKNAGKAKSCSCGKNLVSIP